MQNLHHTTNSQSLRLLQSKVATMTHHDTMDVLTGFAIVVMMMLFVATAAALVEWQSRRLVLCRLSVTKDPRERLRQ
jgi:hypothetical protein